MTPRQSRFQLSGIVRSRRCNWRLRNAFASIGIEDALSISSKDPKLLHCLGFRCCLACLLTIPCMSCDNSTMERTVCEGLAAKHVGITRADYAPCAGEMLAALEELQAALRRVILQGDSTAQPNAKAAYKRLRRLERDAGFQADIFRQLRDGEGAEIERWPDGTMRAFNGHVSTAIAQYGSALGFPNKGNLQEGARHHEWARQAYQQFR